MTAAQPDALDRMPDMGRPKSDVAERLRRWALLLESAAVIGSALRVVRLRTDQAEELAALLKEAADTLEAPLT